MSDIGERIKKIRKEKRKTQSTFAKSLNLSRTHITNLELGVRNLNEAVTKKICETYNINEEWLLFGIGDMYKTEIENLKIDDPKTRHLLEMYSKVDEFTQDYILNMVEETLKLNKNKNTNMK